MFLFDYINHLVMVLISTVVGAMGWLVRTVLTNQKQIALLQQEIHERDRRRDEDRQLLKDVQLDVKEVKRDLLELYKEKL